MSGWTAKRFWTKADVAEIDAGFSVVLDGRPVRTPAKAPLAVPTRALALAIAAEWDAQTGKVDPVSMPLTRAANAAIDKVRAQRAEVAQMIADYGGTDLLCYRAEAPDELVARQATAWDPWLDWAGTALEAPLRVTAGVIPVEQPTKARAALSAAVHALDEFDLAALHDLVAMTGSLVLGLAVARGQLTPDAAWALSRIDEDWQIEQWGEDEEAAGHAAIKKAALGNAARFWSLLHAAA